MGVNCGSMARQNSFIAPGSPRAARSATSLKRTSCKFMGFLLGIGVMLTDQSSHGVGRQVPPVVDLGGGGAILVGSELHNIVEPAVRIDFHRGVRQRRDAAEVDRQASG